MTAVNASPSELEVSTMRTVSRRLVPILVIVWFICYVDRINIGFAAFGLEQTFGMTAAQYGLAAGIFYVGYIFVEVPSNMAMLKFGARFWLTRIIVSWGIVLVIMAFAWNMPSLYVLRFLLGIAEAGLLPGILLYIAHWFPNRQRPKIIAIVMMAVPIATAFGGLFNGWLMDVLDGAFGLEGWRWIFLVGGLITFPFGALLYILLSDKPSDAKWLSAEQKRWLETTLHAEESERAVTAPSGHRAVFKDKKVLILSFAYFCILCGTYPLSYWMPSAIRGVASGLSSTQIGWFTALPFVLGAIALYVTGKRVKSVTSTAPVLVGVGISAVAFLITAVTLNSVPIFAFLAVVVATMATMTAKSLFWSLPTSFLAGAGAATGIAVINSVGATAGFISPYMVGWVQDASGGNVGLSIGVMIAANVGAIVTILALTTVAKRERAQARSKLTSADV
ncbi:ACS family tartrate transporter-like MFS transporter [Rhodococcus sp. 27YEA15]|uniref:MFS transporter n=1 Tax=Rhodococcus sp. 27YEA15 TaxID=3156259 RepID=UPI003C7C7161